MIWYPEVRYRFGAKQAPLMRSIATTVGLFLCSVMLLAESSQSGTNFTFSADPSETVLVVTYSGGTLGVTSSFSLHGDGRLEYRSEISGSGSPTLLEKLEIELTYQEVENLLRVAADFGLVEASKESVEDKIRELHPRRDLPIKTDGGYMTIRISLTSYSRGEEEYGPLTNKITLYTPSHLSQRYDVKELHGFADLGRQMTEFKRLARELASALSKD